MDGQPGRWGWWWRNAPRAWARGGESGKPGEHCRPPGKTGEQTREPAPPVGRDDPRDKLLVPASRFCMSPIKCQDKGLLS
ncbi:uncharacterized protein PS065_017414 isoform 5-T5 [Dugong dugon]